MPLPYAGSQPNVKQYLGYIESKLCVPLYEEKRRILSPSILGYMYSAEPDTFRHGDADLSSVLAGELRAKSAT